MVKHLLSVVMLSLICGVVYPQTMIGVPAGMSLITPCHYCYACAAASDSSVWFTEFDHEQLRQWLPNGQVAVRLLGTAGMYGLAFDPSGNVFVGLDLGDVGSPGKILRIAPNGAQSYVVTGITRPRQLATDASGNVYYATESPSEISEWNASTGVVSVLASNLPYPAEGVAVASDGTVYFSEYGDPSAGDYGVVEKIAPNGAITDIASGFWRCRGLALDENNGYLYLCTESDSEDQGNSGSLIQINLSNYSWGYVVEGLDYPQFPSIGPNGEIYFPMTRDSWIAAYDPNATTTVSTWPGNNEIQTGISGGTWGPNLSGGDLKIEVEDSIVFDGNVQASHPGGTVSGWVRIPYSKLSVLDPNELYTNVDDPEHPTPGVFELPTVTYQADSGSCMVAALAVRQHVGQRWPMLNGGTSPAQGFGESPLAYLIYFAWNDSDRVKDILDPVYNDTSGRMSIVEGGGLGWIFADGSWPASGQTWMNAGYVNNPPAASAWAELDLGAFAGKSRYVYVMWHKNGPFRPPLSHYNLYDYTATFDSTVVDETKQADGLDLTDDTFSGWYLLGDKSIDITPSTRLRVYNDPAVTSSEYLQTDAVMLSKYPIIDNTSVGSTDDFETMIPLSQSDTGPVGLGNHWGKEGLSEQYTVTGGDTAEAQLSSNIYPDAPAGNYWVDVSWDYYNADSLNVTNAQYYVNGSAVAGTINQNRSATNQSGSFVEGNSVGTWSSFYQLPGSYYYSAYQPLTVSMNYDSTSYGGRRLVWNMVRFEPDPPLTVTSVKSSPKGAPTSFELLQNYPNPFNPTTDIEYDLPSKVRVSLKVYDVLGQEIATLYSGQQDAGEHVVTFNGDRFASGVYFYRLQAGGYTSVKKMMLIK